MTNSELEPVALLARAAELDRLARSEEALQALEGCRDWPVPYNERGLVLRAEIMAVSDPIAALDELPEDASMFTTLRGRIGYFLASFRAYSVTRNARAAEKMLEMAAAQIPDEKAEYRHWLAYLRAYMQWQRREYDPASDDLSYALQSPDPALRVFALNLRAWMHAGEENFRLQMSDLHDCLTLYAQYGELCRIRSIAITLQTVAIAAWELYDVEAAAHVARLYEKFPWTPELQVYRFIVLRGLGWCAFLGGDRTNSQTLIEKCKWEGPSAAWRALAHEDCAYMAALDSDSAASRDNIKAAQAIASTVDWQTTRNEEHMALLSLAALLAPTDADDAKRYLSIYHQIQPHGLREAIDASYEPRRTRAYRNYAEGRVEQFHGNDRVAARMIEDAYKIFVKIGFVFRAALAAEALLALTGETRWFNAACTHAAAFPKSAIARRLGAN